MSVNASEAAPVAEGLAARVRRPALTSRIDGVWSLALELAVESGCSFPDEVAGWAVRDLVPADPVAAALAGCDACCDQCTATRRAHP